MIIVAGRSVLRIILSLNPPSGIPKTATTVVTIGNLLPEGITPDHSSEADILSPSAGYDPLPPGVVATTAPADHQDQRVMKSE
ncbi:hypothetical protein CAT723_24070 [Corynebacterium ammoniagenes]|uniref:Uncharacterized protein n=1 Tax=Corynebacterium ammoniagenes TaxID=1697 RepID=A0AAV5GB85_CORAM|nr:hypothetical protein CAT723_24070 [Corynebacterium ammoniagenes]